MTASEHTSRRGWWVAGGLAIAAIVVVVAAFLASGDPDGLERVAEDIGFIGAGEDSPFTVIADYVFPGVDGPMATILAGLLGIAVVFALAWLAGRALARRRG
ncbi:MAG TPA: PDGLE domain-containing protein [Patescibacteria group bacterium]|nr:PDGLE domain-containing protein [Patescibacteria group bacterium]